MTKSMLIDASHPEETRVVVVDSGRLVDFDYESTTKRQIKGNVYLAKITRVEPSLQAAFVEYGGNRHGFLAFSEIHPDYFQIPQADRELIDAPDSNGDDDDSHGDDAPAGAVPESEEEETADVLDEQARRRARLLRSYKIQEVIKRRQILLVQVVKEERGNKGAALTTYLSLAGRYCVLMPNTPRGGGISRKIANPNDRKRLKTIAQDLEVPQGMGLIIRTAGQQRNKSEIKRDYDYLLRLWEQIRETTLGSIAPSLIYEEGDLVKRALRDLYSRDIEEVMVEGEDTYKTGKKLMTMLMPSRARTVKHYKGELPLFVESGVEEQLDSMFSPHVDLPSGGSIVIHVTEALTAIDVNSGKATRERHIDETAVKTNLEAADAIARHLRLRDIAGLIVIDFIDMSENRHQRQVERRLREALKNDRARLQIGKISMFGLLEMSRQRLRPSLQELSSHACPHCNGQGTVRSVESCALQALRRVQDYGLRNEAAILDIHLPLPVAIYLLNNKRDLLVRLEQRFAMRVNVLADEKLQVPAMSFTVVEKRERGDGDEEAEGENKDRQAQPDRRDRPERSGRRRRSERADHDTTMDASEDGDGRKRRRRRRRRRRGDEGEAQSETEQVAAGTEDGDAATATEAEAAENVETGQPAVSDEQEAATETVEASSGDTAAEAPAEEVAPAKPRRRRTRKPKASEAAAAESDAGEPQPVPVQWDGEAANQSDETPVEKPKRTRRPRRTTKARAKETPAEPVENGAENSAVADVALISSAQILAEVEGAETAEPAPAEQPAADEPGVAASASELEPVTDVAAAPESELAAEPEPEPVIAEAEPAPPPKPAKTGWWNRFVR